MRSALYYPHTRIQNEELLKTALLLWDILELIVPDPGYKGAYPDKRIEKAVEMIGVPHFPSEDEKKKAHERIKDFCDDRTGPLPEAFFYQSGKSFNRDFGIYPEKLLDETWTLLKEAKLAGRSERYPANFSFETPAGLSIMAILADCCAGETRSRVTDLGVAYATLTGLLGPRAAKLSDAPPSSDEHLVPITLEVINLRSVGLDKLIDFRERENARSGHAIRDLRHRYVDRIESYVQKLTTTKGSASDQIEIKREFTSDMKDDLAALRDELRFARNEVLFSKEMLVSILALGSSVAFSAFGVHPFAVSEVVTATGGVVTIGGLLGVRNKYLASRRSVLEKHPMAYLYELQSSKVAAM